MSEEESGIGDSSDSHAYDAREEEALHRMEQSEVFSTSIGINTDKSSVKAEAVDEDTPYCMLQWFPSTMDHCIEWARDKFNATFWSKPTIFNQFWRTYSVEEAINQLKNGSVLEDAAVVRKMTTHLPVSVECCITAARLKFEKFFNHSARQLLLDFPLDKKMPDGSQFWQDPRRPPHPLEFNPFSKLHVDFVTTFCQLYADLHSIPSEDCDDERIRAVLKEISLPDFIPKSKRIENYFATEKPECQPVASEVLSQLEECICNVTSAPSELKPHLEENENDTDDCVDFIIAAAHLRAEMYGIPTEAGAQKTTDDVAPAASAAGLVNMELANIAMASSSSQYKSGPSVTATATNESMGRSDEMSDSVKHDLDRSPSACDGCSSSPVHSVPVMSVGRTIRPTYGLSDQQRQANMMSYVLETMLPTTIASLHDIERRAEEADNPHKTSSNEAPKSKMDDDGFAARDFLGRLQHFHKKAVRLSGDANEISNGGKYSTTNKDRNEIHSRFTQLKLEFEQMSRENDEVNEGNTSEYECNRINYIDEVQLMFLDAMFKEFEPKCYEPTQEHKPLKNTDELVSAVVHEMHDVNQLVAHLRPWFDDNSNSDVAPSENELKMRKTGLGMLNGMQVLCDNGLKDSDKYDKIKDKVVLECIKRSPSMERLTPLKRFDDFFRLAWREKVSKLVTACEKLFDFLLSCEEVKN